MSGNSSGFLSDAAGHRQVDHHSACRFLRALGKEPATARLRAFPHKHSLRKREIGARSGGWDLERAQQWQREGRGIYLVINDGGDNARSIRHCRALFIEWDDRPLDWQLQAWRPLGLPRPSLTVSTGGGSAHLYWVLEPAVAPELWAPMQARLIAHAGSDPHCRDASRVMRLPGFAYIGADDRPIARVELLECRDDRYPIERIAACLPPAAAPAAGAARPDPVRSMRSWPSPRPGSTSGQPSRGVAEIQAALARIPRRTPGHNTYAIHRNVLWGLIAACEQAGADADLAIALMEAHSPSACCGWQVAQVARSGNGSVGAGTFWHWARHYGHRTWQRRRTCRPDGEERMPHRASPPQRRGRGHG